MRRAALGVLLAVALIVPGSWALPWLSAAQALDSRVAFTSADLPTWQADGLAWAVAQSQGLVFVGGTFNAIRPPGAAVGAASSLTRHGLAVFDAATGQPTSCAPAAVLPAGTTTAPTVRALNVSPDGKTLYIGGYFSAIGGVGSQHIAALDIASCKVSTTFRPAPSGTVRAIASTATTVYFGGSMVSVHGTARSRAAAVTAVATITPGTLLPWAPVFDADVRSIGLKPDNSLVIVGGDFLNANSQSSRLVVVDSASGATVRNYPPAFVGKGSVVKSIAVDSTGFYTGHEGTGSGSFDGRVAFDWSTLNQRWRDSCLGATQSVVVYKSVLYSGSHAHNCASMKEFPDGARHHLLAEPVNDPTLLPWFPNTNEGPMTAEQIGPRGLAVAPTSTGAFLWVVGEFTHVNGKDQQSITRFGGPPDTVAPSTPSVTATASGGHVTVSWPASVDTDDALLTYIVQRDGVSIPASQQQATSYFWQIPNLTWTDAAPPTGVHTYRVLVSDGTNSVASASHTVTVGSSAGSATVTASADTYGNQGSPSTLFGTQSSLASRGGNPGAVSYLKFALPTPPAGKTITSVTLQLHTTTDSFAPSVDPQPVNLVTAGWSESTLTWNNRPALGTALGSITSATAVNATFLTTLNPSVLAPLAGTTVSIAVSTASTDSLWFWSREYTTATARPQIVITFG